MLLSFFIVMNSMSSYEEKKETKVLNSLALAFSNEIAPIQNAAPVDTPTPRASINQGDTLDEIEGLFNATMSGFEITKNRLGTVMHVRTPIARFENALDGAGAFETDMELGEQGSFAKTLITLMRSEKRGQPFRLDMILNTENDPLTSSKSDDPGIQESRRRVTDLSENLENQGVPTKMLSAGLVRGQQGYIDLYFHKYKPFTFDNEKDEESEANNGEGETP